MLGFIFSSLYLSLVEDYFRACQRERGKKKKKAQQKTTPP